MRSSVEKDFIEVYNPIFNQFIDSIKGINYENIAEPFIPEWGSEYENCEYKLAFVGIDAGNEWGRLEQGHNGLNTWVNKYFPLNSESYKREFIGYNNYDINDLTLGDYKSKSIFFRFVKKFLAAFYNFQNLKGVRNEEKILKSFVWGNVNSFVVPKHAPKGNEAWIEIKKASKIFDKAEYIINAFKPKIIVRLYWDSNNDEYFNSHEGFWDSEEIIAENEICYYFIKKTDTHIFWTRHPNNMRDYPMDFYINSIIKHINDKKIFSEFPGQHTIVPMIDLITKIGKGICKIGEQPECDTVNMIYEPFFRIKDTCRIYFNPYQVYSEKIFKIQLLVYKGYLENWNILKIDIEKRCSDINWEEPKPIGGWFIVGSKAYKNVMDLDILQFQDFIKSIYINDWKGIIDELKK